MAREYEANLGLDYLFRNRPPTVRPPIGAESDWLSRMLLEMRRSGARNLPRSDRSGQLLLFQKLIEGRARGLPAAGTPQLLKLAANIPQGPGDPGALSLWEKLWMHVGEKAPLELQIRVKAEIARLAGVTNYEDFKAVEALLDEAIGKGEGAGEVFLRQELGRLREGLTAEANMAAGKSLEAVREPPDAGARFLERTRAELKRGARAGKPEMEEMTFRPVGKTGTMTAKLPKTPWISAPEIYEEPRVPLFPKTPKEPSVPLELGGGRRLDVDAMGRRFEQMAKEGTRPFHASIEGKRYGGIGKLFETREYVLNRMRRVDAIFDRQYGDVLRKLDADGWRALTQKERKLVTTVIRPQQQSLRKLFTSAMNALGRAESEVLAGKVRIERGGPWLGGYVKAARTGALVPGEWAAELVSASPHAARAFRTNIRWWAEKEGVRPTSKALNAAALEAWENQEYLLAHARTALAGAVSKAEEHPSAPALRARVRNLEERGRWYEGVSGRDITGEEAFERRRSATGSRTIDLSLEGKAKTKEARKLAYLHDRQIRAVLGRTKLDLDELAMVRQTDWDVARGRLAGDVDTGLERMKQALARQRRPGGMLWNQKGWRAKSEMDDDIVRRLMRARTHEQFRKQVYKIKDEVKRKWLGRVLLNVEKGGEAMRGVPLLAGVESVLPRVEKGGEAFGVLRELQEMLPHVNLGKKASVEKALAIFAKIPKKTLKAFPVLREGGLILEVLLKSMK